jgi:hypothetical protein
MLAISIKAVILILGFLLLQSLLVSIHYAQTFIVALNIDEEMGYFLLDLIAGELGWGYLSRDGCLGTSKDPQHRIALGFWLTDGLPLQKFLNLLILVFSLVCKKIESIYKFLLEVLIVLYSERLEFLDFDPLRGN